MATSKPKIMFVGKGKLYNHFKVFKEHFIEVSDLEDAEYVIYSKFVTDVDECEDVNDNLINVCMWDLMNFGDQLKDYPDKKLIYISSNLVFGNDEAKYYPVTSEYSPCCNYGYMKVMSEKYIKTLPNYSIIRTSTLYDGYGYELFLESEIMVQPTRRKWLAEQVLLKIINNKLLNVQHLTEVVTGIDEEKAIEVLYLQVGLTCRKVNKSKIYTSLLI